MSAIFDRMWFGKKGLIGGMGGGSKPSAPKPSASTITSGSGSTLMGQEKKKKRKIVGVTRTQ